MKNSEVQKLSEPLREQRVVHLMMVKLRNGISLSSLANGDDLYEFFQVLAEQNPVVLDIMQDVINSRGNDTNPKVLKKSELLN